MAGPLAHSTAVLTRESVGELDDYGFLAVHALTWFAAANAVGLLLATLLLVPSLGTWLAPLTYGRWVPVHLDLQLYGWCTLPLVALLYRLYLPRHRKSRLPRIAVGFWSACLGFAAISWLGGRSSGKLFLEWSGSSRPLLAAGLLLLEVALVVSWMRRLREGICRETAATIAAKGLLLAGLAIVPLVMVAATSPEVYPSINPDSGGATGGSLMGSSLGVVALLCLLPFAVGARRTSRRNGPRVIVRTLGLLALHFGWFLVLDHGDHSNREWLQIVSLSSLAVWPPALTIYLRQFAWPRGSRRWLVALGAWGALLVTTGILQFLPPVLDRWKFTNALVGHAHLALAGFVTSFNLVVLSVVGAPSRYAAGLARRSTFWMWNVGCAAFVISMMVLGTLEGVRPTAVFYGEGLSRLAYSVRWVAGATMLAASLRWLVSAVPGGHTEAA